nr:PAS domain-containing protein [Salinibacter ruber]
MPSPARNITALLWPSDDMLSTNAKSRLQVVRLLCLLGSLLIPLYGLLYEAARPEATDPMWIRLVIASVLGTFVAGTYVLRTLRTHCVGVAWGLLYLLMAWSVALAAVNQFSGAYVVGMLVVYAVSATLVLVSSQLLRSVLSFLSAGLLLTGAALLWAPAVQLSPLVLCGGMAMVAFVVGVVARWVLRVRRHLADQARELEEQRDRLEGHRAYTNRLLNATDDLFFALDPTGQFQWWNDRVLETTGLSDEDVGSVDALDHFVPAEREKQAKQAIRRVLQTGSGQVEVPLVADDGVAVPYEFVGNPVENLEGERQIVCVGRNVAERKRRERELRESERRFQAMLNDPNILAGVLSPDGTFQKVNDTALGYIEATRADVLGRPFWETPWWETENRSAVRKKVERVAEGEYVRFEAEHVTPDGEARTVTGIMRPVTGEEGEVVSRPGTSPSGNGGRRPFRWRRGGTERLSRTFPGAFFSSTRICSIHWQGDANSGTRASPRRTWKGEVRTTYFRPPWPRSSKCTSGAHSTTRRMRSSRRWTGAGTSTERSRFGTRPERLSPAWQSPRTSPRSAAARKSSSGRTISSNGPRRLPMSAGGSTT